ncbi:hypothetical protein PGT21_025572 [Puccinia graminis f. sp. tritici]|uniref:Uncharacterized protein n=1 Tax=Puccinia graminis f. sp. tritici TaxID=56615 RepID=A0A5B0Q6H5_PUCGR|nr:hypothetical protein PGT21_025572 [Puccinia graminis f. sp. tritici]
MLFNSEGLESMETVGGGTHGGYHPTNLVPLTQAPRLEVCQRSEPPKEGLGT